ncbi:MAG: hypothetical protein JW787_15775, partial [Sedimentisphaerales bacterium]|nr:hypothetical protein [Sedimentisphaerales bacterium]
RYNADPDYSQIPMPARQSRLLHIRNWNLLIRLSAIRLRNLPALRVVGILPTNTRAGSPRYEKYVARLAVVVYGYTVDYACFGHCIRYGCTICRRVRRSINRGISHYFNRDIVGVDGIFR